MEKRICLIYNYAQHYRTDIFKLIEKEFQCDFVFGDKMGDIKKMDYSILSNLKKEVKNKTFIIPPLYYQTGVLKLINEEYNIYLILGDIHCISTWILLILSKFYKKKIYLWSHGWYGRESKIKSIIKKIFFGLADGTFLYGHYARQLMMKSGLDGAKLFVVYNSLSYDKQLALRANLKPSPIYINHFGNNNYNIIFVGRLNNSKRLDILLNASYILKSNQFTINITFIGTGNATEQLNAMVQKFGLKNVWFYGECYNEQELSVLIYNADLCVSPGNIGLTAIHSMVYGTPVITHNNFSYQGPEFEAIEEGKTGTFFEYNNHFSLAKKIQLWFESIPDREEIRKSCYSVIDKYWNPHSQIRVFKENIK